MLEDRLGTHPADQARFDFEILALGEAVRRIETKISELRRVRPAIAPGLRINSSGSIELSRNAVRAENATALDKSTPRSRALLVSSFCIVLSLVVVLASYHFIVR